MCRALHEANLPARKGFALKLKKWEFSSNDNVGLISRASVRFKEKEFAGFYRGRRSETGGKSAKIEAKMLCVSSVFFWCLWHCLQIFFLLQGFADQMG